MSDWKDIKNYKKIYQVSNFGEVKSSARTKERILKAGIDKRGYRFVILQKNGTTKCVRVHLLVWDTFGDNKRNGRILQVDHINNDKTDNRIENLQLLTNRENCSKDKLQTKKSSRFVGVSWLKCAKKWSAEIRIGKDKKYLGLFNCESLAGLAYQKALLCIT